MYLSQSRTKKLLKTNKKVPFPEIYDFFFFLRGGVERGGACWGGGAWAGGGACGGGPGGGRGNVAPTGVGGAFAVHIADVEVDPDTGKVDVLRYTALQDAGKAIHPSYVEGQIQGGAVQGIGWALNEEYVFDDSGNMLNPTFLDYRMPTSLDLPMIDTVVVEVANPGHPYGVRGVGEVPIVPPMAAIANAIHDAVGVRMEQLPMSPGAVLEALWEKNGS